MFADSRRDDLVGAMAVIALLVGTATGNAYVMLGLSVASVVLITIFYGRRIAKGAVLVAFTAAVTATAIGIAMAIR